LLPGTTVVLLEDQPDAAGVRIAAGTPCRVEAESADGVRLVTTAGKRLTVARALLALQRETFADDAPAAAGPAEAWARYADRIQLVTLVGSQAWNLTDAASDEDQRGFFLLPFEDLASLDPAPEQVERPDGDGTFWELEKLLRLGLRSDPNALESLYGPAVRATAFGEEVRAARDAFLSRRVLVTFGRYALAQLERIENRARRNDLMERLARTWSADPARPVDAVTEDLARALAAEEGVGLKGARKETRRVVRDLARSLSDRGLTPDRRPESVRTYLAAAGPGPPGWLAGRFDKPKHAVHLLRILHSGRRILAGRGPLIRVEGGPLRDRLMAIKRGEVDLEEVLAEARGVARDMEAAAAASPLPPRPDRARAEALLRAGRRRAHPFTAAAPATAWRTRPSVRDPARAPHPLPDALLERFLAGRPERTLLAGVSGSHAYGFPSPDSDVDLKAIHLASTRAVVGLGGPRETASFLDVVDEVELDYTSHELGKACAMLLRGDGNMAERVLGDYPVREHPRADELRDLARRNLHRGYLSHYRGFSRALLKELDKGKAAGAPRVKPLLYVFRTALTGLHLLRTGELDASLPRLLERYPAYAGVSELIAAKRAAEGAPLDDDAPYRPLVERLWAELEASAAGSPLPDEPPAAAELSDWLADVRLSEG